MNSVSKELIEQLKKDACEVRKDVLRVANVAGALHVGGDLSMSDILVAVYGYALNFDKDNPDWADRDRFILSKAHGSGALYVTMSRYTHYFSLENVMNTYGHMDSYLGTHTSKEVPGVEVSGGALGHGLPLSVGMALADRLDNGKSRFFVLMGDGEQNEGSIWEAAMAASHYKLGNIIGIVDNNRLSFDGAVEEIMNIEPLADKWKAFGWNVIEVNGHKMEELLEAFSKLPPVETEEPTMIIAHTIKGCGVEFMENDPAWHAGSVDSDMLKKCCDELDQALATGRR